MLLVHTRQSEQLPVYSSVFTLFNIIFNMVTKLSLPSSPNYVSC